MEAATFENGAAAGAALGTVDRGDDVMQKARCAASVIRRLTRAGVRTREDMRPVIAALAHQDKEAKRETIRVLFGDPNVTDADVDTVLRVHTALP